MRRSRAFASIDTGGEPHEPCSRVERPARDDYAPCMRRLPRPNSGIFRATLALALLAWTALAFGAPPVFAANVMQAAQSRSANAAPHCGDAAMMMSAGSHSARSPVVPRGHGDCCHKLCHCLSTCSAMLLVPFAVDGVKPERGPPQA